MPPETPKRFKVGDILTWLPAEDPRVNGYKYGGIYQKGRGEILNYKDFHHSYNCWNIDVRHPGGGVYAMIESEFEEYYSSAAVKPGDKYDPHTYEKKSQIKPGDTIRILVDNASGSPLKKGDQQTVKFIGDYNLITTYRWHLNISECEKVEKCEIDTTPARVTESDITSCPIKIGEIVVFLVDNPWGSSLRKGDKAMVDVIDHYRKQVFLNTGGKFRGWVPICDLHTVYKSVNHPIMDVPPDQVIIPEKPKKLHPTPILFKTEEEPSFKIQVKHHKPVVVKGIGS
ncbi:MAG: hypothetical protein E6Q36_02830 [Chryseobacterium sp.]|nr:MAG: hypothetical protein E6Q36_02830 [Chryseobacterium sp.]